MQPSEGDHSRLHELWREAASVRTVWRLRYNLPPNDPRVLEITDAEVVDDLLLRLYHDLHVQIAHEPSLGVVTNRDEQQRLLDIAKHERETGNLAAQVAAYKRAMSGAPRTPPDPSPAPEKPAGRFQRVKRAWRAVTGDNHG